MSASVPKSKMDDLISSINKATLEANAIANAYAFDYLAKSTLDARGHIADSAGFAIVIVVNPSYRFRKALLAIDPKARHSSGKYTL